MNTLLHLRKWYFPNHSFYFHDDDAVDALMSEPWIDRVFRTGRVHPNETSNCSWEHGYPPNVPPRQVINKCVTSGATKADLWRYALLYRYGGIYSDIDNSPTGFNGETIKKHDDFFGTIEKLGILGQYFLASSPRHPYLRHIMNDALDHLRMSENVMDNLPEKWTGPGAVKRGFCFFMEAANVTNDGYISSGVYVGDENRSVTVMGSKNREKEYIVRNGLGNQKEELYKALNVSHFSDVRKQNRNKKDVVSCEEHLNRTQENPNKKANYIIVEGRYVDADAIV